jgi:hypothetical protein
VHAVTNDRRLPPVILEKLDKGKPDKAIERYRHALEKAQKAVK